MRSPKKTPLVVAFGRESSQWTPFGGGVVASATPSVPGVCGGELVALPDVEPIAKVDPMLIARLLIGGVPGFSGESDHFWRGTPPH